MDPRIEALLEIGQSLWLDDLSRALLQSGELQALIDEGIRGVTSNPSIFERAISEGSEYDAQLSELAIDNREIREIYEALVVEDIQQTAERLSPIFEASEGLDGYVSLEADPGLTRDTEATVEEIRHLHQAVDRANAMFKVPATEQGYPAIEQLIADGININITLMFSLEQYRSVAAAYQSGLERLVASGGDPGTVASVASFFVSRLDSKVDPLLEEVGGDELKGKTAIANAKLAYQAFQEVLGSDRWQALSDQGARVQRVLWGSTSTKNPDDSNTRYVDRLIGPHTVNTLPRKTFEAFRHHGQASRSVDQQVERARADLARLAEVGIELDRVTEELLNEGVAKFSRSMQSLLEAIEQKVDKIRSGAEIAAE